MNYIFKKYFYNHLTNKYVTMIQTCSLCVLKNYNNIKTPLLMLKPIHSKVSPEIYFHIHMLNTSIDLLLPAFFVTFIKHVSF